MAAKPPTKAPTNAVTNMSKVEDPPNGITCAIFCERMLSFFRSIQKDKKAHKINMPEKPDKNPGPMGCIINKATRKEIIAMLHHGRNMPAIKANVAVSKVASKNLIVIRNW